jgi:hypothetical protein
LVLALLVIIIFLLSPRTKKIELMVYKAAFFALLKDE